MRRSFQTLPITVLALLGFTTVAGAQESTTRGFTIGLHASGASLTVQDQERNNAGGGGIQVGYGINRRFTLYVRADGAQFDEQATANLEGDWTLGHFDLGVRFNFANSLRSWVPFVTAAFGARAVTVQNPMFEDEVVDQVTFSGPAFTLGGGIAVYLSESWALDLALLGSGGEFQTLTIDNTSVTGFDLDASSTRFNVGLSWWP